MTPTETFAAVALHGLLAGRNHLAAPYTPEELAILSANIANMLVKQLNENN
jgi:hypothetical protein